MLPERYISRGKCFQRLSQLARCPMFRCPQGRMLELHVSHQGGVLKRFACVVLGNVNFFVAFLDCTLTVDLLVGCTFDCDRCEIRGGREESKASAGGPQIVKLVAVATGTD